MKKNTIIIAVAVVAVVALGILSFVLNGKLNETRAERDARARDIVNLNDQLRKSREETAAKQTELEAATQTAKAKQAQLERELADMTASRAAAERQLETTVAKLNDATDKIRIQQESLEKLEKTREELAAQLDDLGKQLTGLQKNIDILEKQLAAEGTQRGKAERELAELMHERDVLAGQWNSLKKVQERLVQIRDEQKVAEQKQKEEQKLAIETRKRQIGNRGFFVKDGKNTFDPEAWRLFRHD